MPTPSNYTNNLIETLYYLLYAKYGNNSIASSDQNQFKYKVFTTIFEYGPAWKQRLIIQEKLAKLNPDSDDVMNSSIKINNHAENPDTEPGTDAFEPLTGINSQSASTLKRGKLEGYSMLNELLETDVTEEFLGRFKKLFIKFVMPQAPLWYRSIPGSEEVVDDALMCDDYPSVYGNYRTQTFQEIWETAEDFINDYQNCGIPPTI
jgi:hypothetical protein